ncbi:MAG: AI-2E family transporter, partial [Candidatus Doudnabacteria bacterium]
ISMPKKQVTLNTSSIVIVKIVLVLLGLVFLYFVRDVVMVLFTAVVISAALNPTVNWLQKKHIPRTLSVLLIYTVLLSIVVLSIYLLIPPIVTQVKDLANQFPDFYEQLAQKGMKLKAFSAREDLLSNIQNVVSSLGDNITGATRSIFGTLGTIFGSFISVFVILVLSFYLTVQKDALKSFIRAITPARRQKHIIELVDRVQHKIGQWLSGQIFLCFIVGILTFLGLTLLGVRYSLVLALFAGLIEIIPYVGPVLGGLPAAFLAFTQSPILALFVIILFFVVQQIENHILVPKVMQKTVGLNPIVVILALLAGGKLAGILGMILAIPVATVVTVFVQDYMELKNRAQIAKKSKTNV